MTTDFHMSDEQLNLWIAENVFDFKRNELKINNDIWGYESISPDEKYWFNLDLQGNITDSSFAPNYCNSISYAAQVMYKLGLACIPQSNEDGSYDWFVCDCDYIVYESHKHTIYEKNDSGVSNPSLSRSICFAAYYSIMNGSDDDK